MPGFPLPADASRPERAAAAPAPGVRFPSHYAGCYGCGPDVVGGLHLEVVAGEGLTVTGRMQVQPEHQGAPGLAHGGLVATAFDDVLGFTLWLLARPAVTGGLEIAYRSPVPVGRQLWIEAEILGQAGRKVYTHGLGRLDGPDGPLVAEAWGLFVIVGVEHFARYAPARALDRLERLGSRAESGSPQPYNP